MPASATVAANATTATFTASTGTIPSSQSAAITAALNGSSQTVTLLLTGCVLISSLQCALPTLASGAYTLCTVTLTGQAPAGGAVITLSTNNPMLKVPQSPSVAAGATSVNFTAGTGYFSTDQSGVITASYNGSSATANESLSASVALEGLRCPVTTLSQNSSATCTAILMQAIPAGATVAVSLSSSDPALQIPVLQPVVPNQSSQVNFSVTTGGLTANKTATLTVSLYGVAMTVKFTLIAPLTVSALQCNANRLASNSSTACTVTLTGAAPTGGASVSLGCDPQRSHAARFRNCRGQRNNRHLHRQHRLDSVRSNRYPYRISQWPYSNSFPFADGSHPDLVPAVPRDPGVQRQHRLHRNFEQAR